MSFACFFDRDIFFRLISAEDSVKKDTERECNDRMAADSAKENDHCKDSGRNRTKIQNESADGKHNDRIWQEADDHIQRVPECLLRAADKVGNYGKDIEEYAE